MESKDVNDNPSVFRVREILCKCVQSIESGDESCVNELVTFLDSISDSAFSDLENQDAQDNALAVVSEIHRFLSSPPLLDQAVFDVFSFALPMAVAKFARLSDRCLEVAEGIVDYFVARCSPRDMLTILCEALAYVGSTENASVYSAPLLKGLSKVFLLIQRRHFEQVNASFPVIVNALKTFSSDFDDEDTNFINFFDRVLDTCNSICALCEKLRDKANEKLRALLGWYVLQIMALFSQRMGYKISSCFPLVAKLLSFVPFCRLSCLGLVTGSDVDLLINTVFEGEENGYTSDLTIVRCGAVLSVIWGHISEDATNAVGEDICAIKNELLSNRIRRWQALDMMKQILSSPSMPWELKKHTVNFLLCITDGLNIGLCDDSQTDCSEYTPSLFASLQAITKVIVYAPDATLRKDGFEALKRVLADIPISQRFDVLEALMRNSDSSSMVALLLDVLRAEMHKEKGLRISIVNCVGENEGKANPVSSLWTADVLKLVELVLKPPKGGPPSFPEHGEAVLAALNLYRFILMTESAGKTNYTGVLSKKNLDKAYNEWLLPLRTLVTGIMAENKDNYGQVSSDALCAVNPIELVLFRCIELVEEELKHST